MFRSVVLCCFTLCYMLTSQTGGNGKYTHPNTIQSGRLIIIWHLWTQEFSYNIEHKAVLSKISIFAWSLLHNRIPTTDNLLQWGLHQNQTFKCWWLWFSRGYQTFVFVLWFFGLIWNMVLLWLVYVTVTPTLISDHPHQFGHLGESSKHHWTTMHLFCYLAFGWYEMKETIEYSSTKSTFYFNCSTKLSFKHFGILNDILLHPHVYYSNYYTKLRYVYHHQW